MIPDFTACANVFASAPPGLYDQYIYTGPVRGILATAVGGPALVTVAGCKAVCGSGNEYYPWTTVSGTISTWVLPIMGLLLQAPYQSNAFRETVGAMARWLGSPCASLAYILWNIEASSRCALIVDMASPYAEVPPPDSQFGGIRDSFYILSIMNQYAVKPAMRSPAAQKLLRIALFSDTLQLEAPGHEIATLVKKRQKLARSLREGRRRGVVPVFISLMWFLFSLAISIQAAFGQLGENATAHNLALGLLLAWLPVLILCSIVDRNPVAPETTRYKLNRLMEAVRRALLNPNLRATYTPEATFVPDDFRWTAALANDADFDDGFFIKFGGQARVRWHYGVAQIVLRGIEESYVARYGRDWLHDSVAARAALVRGPFQSQGPRWYDVREAWQVISSVLIVACTACGAMIISYSTPTMGLGCRSGGHMVYLVASLGIFALELLSWWLVPIGAVPTSDPITRLGQQIERRLSRAPSTSLNLALTMRVHRWMMWWRGKSTRDRLEMLLFRPLEIGNTAWLCYIIFAQTVGAYQNCECFGSTWSFGGGYVDFANYSYYRENGVLLYWGLGTGLSSTVMVLAFIFIVTEWCTQSHLSTEDLIAARRGLRTTRCFKKYTVWLRHAPHHHVVRALRALLRRWGADAWFGTPTRLVWSSHSSMTAARAMAAAGGTIAGRTRSGGWGRRPSRLPVAAAAVVARFTMPSRTNTEEDDEVMLLDRKNGVLVRQWSFAPSSRLGTPPESSVPVSPRSGGRGDEWGFASSDMKDGREKQ